MLRCPKFIVARKDGLAFQLFMYMMAVIVSILLLQAVAEQALIKTVLTLPDSVKQPMLSLAEQADVLIEEGDMDELADWANAQPYYLFVLDSNYKPLTHRDMHPHFEFKLRFLRELDAPLSDRVSKPLIGLPLSKGNTLVVQLPSDAHPAHQFFLYFNAIKVVIAFVILAMFSLILARKLNQPLNRLREASHRLAQGEFNVNVVSELHSTTREFNELARDFDDMAHEIQSLAKKQRRLIRDVSHELRTPLARQNLALHLLRSKLAPEEQGLADRIEHEVDQMNDLVEEILELSRLESQRYDARLLPIDLESYASALVNEAQLQLKPNQTLSLHLEDDISAVKGDERLVSRCIRNLITNAIKYAGDDAYIDVTLYGWQEHIVLVISDDGAGIAESQLEQIFDPFTRLETARDKQSGGYGLGLAIVKEAMHLMGGKVTACNRKQGGLQIQLWFVISESNEHP
ncbi:sensor histidine kinase [Vibrio sinensis]|uniref:histidine kinase n=1 Tax=Vibrio sinensis TaxID=2302434 RepID=A0A3A6QBK7_9VIBR|nr:histidine kinase sensor domain-containing protein [Vibrio sinensis]RJX65771.1 sensor histidine kinase [Vibrio sinensis]